MGGLLAMHEGDLIIPHPLPKSLHYNACLQKLVKRLIQICHRIK